MGMYAWFTDSEGKKNKTTIAQNLDVEVVEPNFPEEGVTDVQPGQTISKDPAVKNNSDTLTGWLFTEIRVPMAAVVVEGAEAAEKLPLFTFEVNDGWKQLQEFEDGDTKVYRFGWETTVAPGGNQTGNIFDEVTFVNLDGSAQGLALSEQLVKVIGYGIQDAEQFEGDVAKAWNAYKLQNGIKDGEGNTIAAALIASAAGNKLQFVQGTPKVGDMLDAGEVIEVVEDVEHLPVSNVSPLVSTANLSKVVTVEDMVPTKPSSTANWFKDMTSVTTMDLAGLDLTEAVSVNQTSNMFANTPELHTVKTDSESITSLLKSDFVETSPGIVERWLQWAFYNRDERAYILVRHLGRLHVGDVVQNHSVDAVFGIVNDSWNRQYANDPNCEWDGWSVPNFDPIPTKLYALDQIVLPRFAADAQFLPAVEEMDLSNMQIRAEYDRNFAYVLPDVLHLSTGDTAMQRVIISNYTLSVCSTIRLAVTDSHFRNVDTGEQVTEHSGSTEAVITKSGTYAYYAVVNIEGAYVPSTNTVYLMQPDNFSKYFQRKTKTVADLDGYASETTLSYWCYGGNEKEIVGTLGLFEASGADGGLGQSWLANNIIGGVSLMWTSDNPNQWCCMSDEGYSVDATELYPMLAAMTSLDDVPSMWNHATKIVCLEALPTTGTLEDNFFLWPYQSNCWNGLFDDCKWSDGYIEVSKNLSTVGAVFSKAAITFTKQ